MEISKHSRIKANEDWNGSGLGSYFFIPFGFLLLISSHCQRDLFLSQKKKRKNNKNELQPSSISSHKYHGTWAVSFSRKLFIWNALLRIFLQALQLLHRDLSMPSQYIEQLIVIYVDEYLPSLSSVQASLLVKNTCGLCI